MLMTFLVDLALGATMSPPQTASCPADALHVATLPTYIVCERLGTLNGSFVFLSTSSSSPPLTLSKRIYAQNVTATWAGFSRANVTGAADDLIGNAFLANGGEPDYAAVLAAVPPIISGWGAKQQFGYAGQHSFTGSRNGTVDIVLDHLGDAGEWGGYPRPPNVIGADEYARGQLDVYEGLIGGRLPILHWAYKVNATVRWEMSVAPRPNLDGNHEQGAMFRFSRVVSDEADGSGARLDTVRFFDTYAYAPELDPAPEDFYAALLAQHTYWDEQWATEGVASFRLPGEVGEVLSDQLYLSLTRDMITRHSVEWPRYGVCGGMGGCSYGDPKNNGFQEVFTASLAAALELGAFPYARLVLRNFLKHYLRGRTGLVYYRGLELAQSARSLSLIAQYARFTNDTSLLLEHYDQIMGIVGLLRKRRAKALKLPSSDPAFGLPIGNDEAEYPSEDSNPGLSPCMSPLC